MVPKRDNSQVITIERGALDETIQGYQEAIMKQCNQKMKAQVIQCRDWVIIRVFHNIRKLEQGKFGASLKESYEIQRVLG